MERASLCMIFKRLFFLSFFLLLCNVKMIYATNLPTAPASNDQAPIKIGISTDLSGIDSPVGQAMRDGIKLYFDTVNEEGGIQGRKLDLIALDDGYDPNRAAKNVRQLIDQDQVLALIGNIGTPTAIVTVPIVNEKKTLLFAARTGAAILRREPPDRYVINLRVGYKKEVESIINGLLSVGIKPEEFAFFTQNDTFGDTIYHDAINMLKAKGLPHPELLPYGRYERTTGDVIPGLSRIVEEVIKPPKVFILGGVKDPNAKFINLAIKQFPKAIFIVFSGLINTKDLSKEADNHVIVSQVMPLYVSDLPIVKEYLEINQKNGKNAPANIVSFEGFVAAKIFVIGARRAAANNQLTREGIINGLESLHDVDIGIGSPITLDKNNHTVLNQSWLTIFSNGELRPFNLKNLKVISQ